MNLIHRHIFTNVVLTCAASVALFASIMVLGSALKDLLGHVLAGQLSWEIVVYLTALSFPVVTAYALPMGMLSGVLLVLGRMSSDREVTALRAAGMSVAWVSAPILFCGLLGVLLTLMINFQFMPLAKVTYETELRNAIRQNPLSIIVPKTFIREFPGYVLYAGDKKNTVLKDFWLWELDSKNRVKRSVRAESGKIVFDEDRQTLVLTLHHVQAEVRDDKNPENFAEERGAASSDEASFNLPLEKAGAAGIVHVKPTWLTFDQLLQQWHDADKPGNGLSREEQEKRDKQKMRVQITIQQKFSAAFSVLSFTLVAIPLGIKVSRKETSANLGIGLALAMAYYFATIVIGWLENQPHLRPDLLMWLPNFAFQALGLWMFYRVDRK